jgi:hypothetical protein
MVKIANHADPKQTLGTTDVNPRGRFTTAVAAAAAAADYEHDQSRLRQQ